MTVLPVFINIFRQSENLTFTGNKYIILFENEYQFFVLDLSI